MTDRTCIKNKSYQKNGYEKPRIKVFIWDVKRISERSGNWGPPWHNWANSS